MAVRRLVAALVIVACGLLTIPAAVTNASTATAVPKPSTVSHSEVTTSAVTTSQTTTRHQPQTDHTVTTTDRSSTEHSVPHDSATDHPDHHDSATHHNGVHADNATESHGHEDEHKCPPDGEEGVRYAVAKFDFGHVRDPLIVAVWVLFVTYAKIGDVNLYRHRLY